MANSLHLRNILTCLMFCLAIGISGSVPAQEWEGESGEGFDSGDRGGNFGREGGFGGGRWGGGGREFGRGGMRGGFRGGPPDEGGGDANWGGGGFRGGRWGGRGGFNPEEGFDAERPASPAGGAAATSAMKPRERITVDLPATFAEGDRDGDGQIGLYEWRQWKRGDMPTFLALDHNGDGYLTPAELVKGPRMSATSSMLAGTAAPAATTLAPGVATATQPVSTMPATAATSAPAGDGARIALARFNLMDKNRNSQIDPEEWASSSIIKPQFAAAGIDLQNPMPKDQFVQHFIQLNPPKN